MITSRPQPWHAAILAVVTSLSSAERVAAQTESGSDPEVAPAPASERPAITIVRTDDPPSIDGRLDDAVWQLAPVIADFTQVDPDEGQAPTERTEVRILYDADYLYVGIQCFDSDAPAIRATQMQRDGDLSFDDVVSIAIDPFFNLRDGFFFEMNPAGSKGDALIENNRNLRFDWDGIWEGKSSRDDQGWSVEMEIPFKTLNFNPDTTRWGFNVQRVVRRNEEVDRWAAPVRTLGITSMSTAGVIEGIEDIRQGLGLDIKPFIALKFKHDNVREDNDFLVDPGLDLFYKLTPELTLALTFNTDFAETEVDQRQVNLSRFSLFFPEKRDFFLQDAGIFSFGGIRRNPLPFFSRRIGLGADGTPVDIIAGIKLTGRVGDMNIGLLNVQLDEDDSVDSKNITVGRLSYNIFEESTIGIITTVGDPRTNGDNLLVGADFNFRDSKRFAPDVLQGNLFFMHTETSDLEGRQNSFGGRINYNSDVFRWFAAFTQIDENFNPALGFSNRRGIREYIASLRYRWRPHTSIKRIDLQSRTTIITDLGNKLETRRSTLPEFVMEWRSGDFVRVEIESTEEALTSDFAIQPGIIIPQDDYTFTRFQLGGGTSRSRPIRVSGRFEFGEFFSGDRIDMVGELDFRPNRFFAINVGYEQNEIDLPQGDFIVRLARTRLDINFTPDVSWNTFVQWDNSSDTMGINSRLKWIIEPGQEIFFVVNQGFSTIDDRFEALTTEITIKVGLTLRF